MKYTTKSPEEYHFHPSPSIGLTDEQIAVRLEQGFVNNIPFKSRHRLFFIILRNILSLYNIISLTIMVFLLLANKPLSLLILLGVIPLTVINMYFDIRAHHDLFVSVNINKPTSKVTRNKRVYTVTDDRVVLDDVIHLLEGSYSPVDGKIIEGAVLIDTSSIDGKKELIERRVGDLVLTGSRIVYGNAYMRTHDVGRNSSLGKIAQISKKIYAKNSEYSTFLKKISAFCSLFAVLLLVLSAVVFGVQGQFNNRNFFEVMSPTSELLAIIYPLGLFAFACLAYLVHNKRTKGIVITNELSSIDSLGDCDIACFDKTGTLSDGLLSVKKVVSLGQYNQEDISQLISNVIVTTKDTSYIGKSLSKTFAKDLNMTSLYAFLYSPTTKYIGATFKGGKTYLVGEIDNMNLINKESVLRNAEEYLNKGYKVFLLAESSSPILRGKITGSYFPLAMIILGENLRSGAQDMINYFNDQKIETKIISGDEFAYTQEFASKLGYNPNSVVSLKDKDEAFVKEAASKYSVFSDADAYQKQMIIESLQEKGHRVAMFGNGNNDTLALKTANCSLAMEDSSHLTKGVSQFIIRKNRFDKIQTLFEESRNTRMNISNIITLNLTKYVSLWLFACIYLMVSWISQVPEIRNPLTFNHFIIADFLCVELLSLLLAFDKNKNKLQQKRSPLHTLLKSFCLAIVVLYSLGSIYIAYALHLNGVTYTGIEYDSIENIYYSSQVVALSSLCITLTFIFAALMVVRPLNRYRLLVSAIIYFPSVVLLFGCAIYSFVNKQNNILLFDVNVLIGPNYLVLALGLAISIALYLFIYRLVIVTSMIKKEEKKDVEN